MAALLRSARVLKFSASPLLQAKGANSHGQRICRFYSRAAGGRGIGVCLRQIISGPFSVNSLSPCSSAWARLGVRYYGMAAEQEVVAQDEPSLTIHTRQAKQFEWALAKLDSSIRRTGRISTTLLQRLFDDVCRTGCPTVNQALLLLRSCGSLLPEMSFAERTKLAHHMWDKLQQLGAVYDVSHYNALLKVYLQNEFDFSPTEFLAKMEEANVQPNRVTYQRLIAAYCQVGDVEGASKILGFMKSKDLPITEAVFNSLLVGHSRAGDMDSAVNILSVMRGVGVEPGLETYQALLTAYAEKGDIGKIKETLDTLKNTDITLMDRDLLQVVVGLAKAGHQQHMLEILEHLSHDRTFLPAAINLCLGLITQNHEDTAFALLKTFPIAQTNSQDGDTLDLGNFFLRHCVNMNKSPEKLVGFCKELRDSNLHTTPLQFTLFCALEANNTALVTGLMKMMKEEGIPLRPHYFWPLLSQHQKVQNITGVLDVLKVMTELSVLPDTDTYSYYVFPTFPSVESACSALKDIGLIVDSYVLESSVLQVEASSGNLSRLFDLLSSSSLPDIDLGAFRGPLIAGFKKSNDVENMVNITELLSKDGRFTQTDPDTAATVICQLFYSMSEKDVHAKVETLREYLHQLQKRGVTVPGSVYSKIRAILHSYHLPELIKDVFALRQKDVKSIDADSKSTASLEKTLEELKSQGLSGDSAQAQMVFKEVIRALCDEENLSRALELKAEHEDKMSTSCYALLINLCCNQDNPEEALNLKRELARKDSEARLDGNKYMNLVRVLCNHNQLEDALDLLKEMKEMGVVVEDATVTRFFYTLNDAAKKGQVSIIRSLQETAFTLGLIKPSVRLCSPLLTAYLKNEDLAGALQAAVECHKQYNLMCRIHDILCALVEKGDTELLEKAMDFLNQVQGEMNMLYNLFFAFLQTGHYKEARKIIETPGLRAKPVRLQWYAEKCIANQQMEALETMVDFTAKLFECDRDEMYHYLLRLCKQTNDWHKADGIWMKMQEENVIPRERTMRLLADILKSNNQTVPFKMSEMWYEEPEAKREPSEVKHADRSTPSVLEESPSDYSLKLKALVKKRKFQEAYSFLEDADRNGVTLNFDSYDILIRALLSSGNFEDAMAVKDIATSRIEGFQMSSMATSLYIISLAKRDRPQDALTSLKTMLEKDQVPSQMALRQLFRCLGRHGDTKSIQELEGLLKKLGSSLDLSGVIHNNMVLSYIANGNVATAVESLESLYTQGSDSSKTHISYIFRYVLEENSEACDKLFAMAERLCNHFASYTAAMDLFLVYVDMDKIDEARDLLQRCAALAEQTDDLMGYIAKVSKKAGQTVKIKKLCELIPDLLQKDTTYTYLMKCHAQDNDLASAKALYQRMQVEGLPINNLSLKRLAQLYSKAGEIAPFTEPPNSFTYYAEELKDSMLQRPEEA